ncbi:MAG: hypothetical protein D6786_03365 [Gammaproteobacteria bacterium]|nr:MAG: hypothetical protein D6786_03365 [Gammaproteobacteria bacterium]
MLKMNHPFRILASLILLALSFASPATESGVEVELTGSPLAGVRVLGLEVAGFRDETARYGLDGGEIERSYRQRLAQAGFELVGMQRTTSIPGAARLQLRLYSNRTDYGYYSYLLALRLRQKVRLGERGLLYATTWEGFRQGIARDNELPKVARQAQELLEEFLEAHRRQNGGGP